MGRTTWFDVDGLRKGEWTAEEDRKLVVYINEHGLGEWGSLPKRAGLQRCGKSCRLRWLNYLRPGIKRGLQRCGKSCRLRWLNYLRPGIKRGKFTPQEEEEIIKYHALLGNRWAAIAKQMPNRTDNDIKNHWNSCLKKRLAKKGIDPMTHEATTTTSLTVDVTSSSTTSSPTPSPTSSSFSSCSSTGSARFLNKLAAGISSRKHGLESIKTVILAEQPREAVDEEKMMTINMKEKELISCYMEIDETMSIDELPCDDSTSGFVAFDDYSLIDPYRDSVYVSDFYDETEHLDLFLL